MTRGCKCDPDDVSQLQCQRDPKPIAITAASQKRQLARASAVCQGGAADASACARTCYVQLSVTSNVYKWEALDAAAPANSGSSYGEHREKNLPSQVVPPTSFLQAAFALVKNEMTPDPNLTGGAPL